MNKVIKRALLGIAAIGTLLAAGAARADYTGEQLMTAAETAIKNGVPGSDFITILEGATVAAMAYVNTKVHALRLEIVNEWAEGKITGEERFNQYANLEDIQNRLEVAKNKQYNDDPDKGKEPSFAEFLADVPLGPTLPPEINLTLVAGSGVCYMVNPLIWDGDSSHPPVLSGSMHVTTTPTGGFILSSYSVTLGSFTINGLASGTTTVHQRPVGPASTFQFTQPIGPTVLAFEAFTEEELHNDLYPASNPIVYLNDIQGYVDLTTSTVWMCSSEPMIVPGAPGRGPVDNIGRLDAGARAVFDATAGTLTFGENTDLNLLPDVTMVRQADGTYVSHTGAGEAAIGASLSLSVLTYLGQDGDGTRRFSDGLFSITDAAGGTYVSGSLTDVRIDPLTYQFIATAVLDDTSDDLSSLFLDHWKSLDTQEIRFMSPIGAADLIAGTGDFTVNWTTGSDWVSLIPEPTALSLLTVCGLALLRRRRS